jgi:hypothetical protein
VAARLGGELAIPDLNLIKQAKQGWRG